MSSNSSDAWMHHARQWSKVGHPPRPTAEDAAFSQEAVLEWCDPERLDEPVPAVLREVRRALQFDFGKFDYAIVDGSVILSDVNRTPGAGEAAQHAETVQVLAGGIRQWLPGVG